MKNVIILENTRKEETLLEDIADTTAPAEVAQVSGLVNLAGRYN